MKSSVSTMVEVTGFLASVSALVLYVRLRSASSLRHTGGWVGWGVGGARTQAARG